GLRILHQPLPARPAHFLGRVRVSNQSLPNIPQLKVFLLRTPRLPALEVCQPTRDAQLAEFVNLLLQVAKLRRHCLGAISLASMPLDGAFISPPAHAARKQLFDPWPLP